LQGTQELAHGVKSNSADGKVSSLSMATAFARQTYDPFGLGPTTR